MKSGGSSLPTCDYYILFSTLYYIYEGLEIKIIETYDPFED